MKIVKGTTDCIEDCADILAHSELGHNYFAAEGSALAAVREAAASDYFYVAMEEQNCLGFMYYLPKGAFHAFPYLHLIAVDESRRGQGIGKQMMKYLEKIVQSNKIFLVVASFNPEGQKFYENIGYKQVGEIESLYREGISEKLMMKKINHE